MTILGHTKLIIIIIIIINIISKAHQGQHANTNLIHYYISTFLKSLSEMVSMLAMFRSFHVHIDAKQKHLGCKKSARPIRSHNGYISDQKL